jgi:type IV pilus assembly protein PilY1
MSRREQQRLVRTAIIVSAAVVIVGGGTVMWREVRGVAAGSLADNCIGSLTATQYPGGVSSASSVQPLGTGLQLNTNLVPFNPQQIILPFTQDLTVKYLYRNAGASHSFGWFYYDQIASFLDSTGKLIDADGDGIADWFQTKKAPQRPKDGLFHISSGTTPDLLNSSLNYADGGSYPHMPNLLETLTGPGSGSMIFKLCDDDGDLNTYGVGSTAGTDPISDIVATNDGIPDYDVNGDGTAGNEQDRAVDLGLIQGNREIIFFMMTYYGSSLPNTGLGTGTSGSSSVSTMPFFTKNMLNPDRGTLAPGTVLDKVAIKCTPAESGDDSACWNPVGGTNGWLTPDAQARLNSATYGNIDITQDNTVYPIVVDSTGSGSHFVVLPPAANPNLWLIGYEDLPNNVGDNDFNDVVFMVNRSNGGQVISNVVSNIPVGQQATTAISQVQISYTASFPAPGCTGVSASINLYYSVDNGVTWNAVPESSLTSGTVVIDVLGAGLVGSQLKWRADFVSPVQACEPVLTSFNIGYTAVSNGIFKYAAPVPLANVVYGGALETPPFPTTEPTPTNSDFSLRGHFYSTQLYSQTNTTTTAIVQNWDAGAVLASLIPDARKIYTSIGGTTVPFNIANGVSLYPLLIPTASRTLLNNAKLVYDYNGDNVVDNNDAQFLLQWTRGWEFAAGITYTPAQPILPLKRAWPLAAIHTSSPAIVGPPVAPSWISGSAAPPALASAHNNFGTTWVDRPARAIVGGQDGMLHAFDAGAFRPTADPNCPASLIRGCYATAGTTESEYGTGAEVWAWIPPSQISQLKNNQPVSKTYLPGSNPQSEVDGSVAADDIWDPNLNGGSFRTIAYASLGTGQQYITAVEMTTDTPAAIWAQDFSDANFNGNTLSPSIGLANVTGSPAYHQMLFFSSGLSSLVGDIYFYMIDALTGTTVQKIQLNTGVNAAQAFGFAAYVNLVDADGDGLVDRGYAADTNGRVWKVDTTTNKACVIASLGESVFSGMAATTLGTSSAPKVELFVGGGPNPDGTGTVAPQYHIFALYDTDAVGTCTNLGAVSVYEIALAPGNQVWAAPTVNDQDVFFATADASSVSICSAGSGTLLESPIAGNGSGAPLGGMTAVTTQAISGAPISSLRIYDGHAIVNSVGGSTSVIGGSAWNNNSSAAAGTGLISTMKTVLWQEN